MKIASFLSAVILLLLCGKRDGSLLAQDTRLWATYYGGTVADYASSVTTDAAGNVYFTGYTASTTGISSGGFQNTNAGFQDIFLVKFDATASGLRITEGRSLNTVPAWQWMGWEMFTWQEIQTVLRALLRVDFKIRLEEAMRCSL